jgi:hypothetical protein
MTTDPTDHP